MVEVKVQRGNPRVNDLDDEANDDLELMSALKLRVRTMTGFREPKRIREFIGLAVNVAIDKLNRTAGW